MVNRLFILLIGIAFVGCGADEVESNPKNLDDLLDEIYGTEEFEEFEGNEADMIKERDSLEIRMSKKNFLFTCLDNCGGGGVPEGSMRNGLKPFDIEKYSTDSLYSVEFTFIDDCCLEFVGDINRSKEGLGLTYRNISGAGCDCHCQYTYRFEMETFGKPIHDITLNEKSLNTIEENHYKSQVEYEFVRIFLDEERATIYSSVAEDKSEDYNRLTLKMTGNVVDENKSHTSGYNLYILEEKDTVKSEIMKNSSFDIDLALGKKYTFGFKKKGYASKHLIIDIIDCGDYEDHQYGFEFPMELVLEKDNSNNPSKEVGVLKYNNKTGYIENAK
jgi:hypothetical protein